MAGYIMRMAYLIIVAIFIISPSAAQAEYDYIKISDPFLRKIPLAIPLFKAQEAGQANSTIAKKSADLLYETIDFTGYSRLP